MVNIFNEKNYIVIKRVQKTKSHGQTRGTLFTETLRIFLD